LTVIYELGDLFWIEQVVATHVNLANGTSTNVNLTFSKAGDIIGVFDMHSTATEETAYSVMVRTAAFTLVTLPLANQVQIQSFIRNDTGFALTLNHHITLLMRRPAR